MRIAYRVQQFWAALPHNGRGIDSALLTPYLIAAQVDLFRRMPPSEQRHAYAVLQTLQREGPCEGALAQAALLHDVGKAADRVRLWHRVVAVLLQSIHPRLLERLALDNGGSWRYPFFVQWQHAVLGANMAAEAGTDALALSLIGWHHTPVEHTTLSAIGRGFLSRLQWADEKN